MKLSVWARRQGISYQTAWRWVKDDVMPVPWRQLPTGTILVDTSSDELVGGVALYARVGSHDQRADLDRQLARLSVYAAEQGLHVVRAPLRHQRSSGCGARACAPSPRFLRAPEPPGSGRPPFPCKEERAARVVHLGSGRSGKNESCTLRAVGAEDGRQAIFVRIRSVAGCGPRRDPSVRCRWDSGTSIRRQHCSGDVVGIRNKCLRI
jgi:hypothetical protein